MLQWLGGAGACPGTGGPDTVCVVMGIASQASGVVHEVELCVSVLSWVEGDGVLPGREVGDDVVCEAEIHGGRVKAFER